MKNVALALAIVLMATPAFAQLGGALGKLNKAKEQADKLKEFTVSEEDERKIGDLVSSQLREKYGVVQDEAVTKYVTLLGTVLAQASSRPALHWEFVILDTDGVNAFAAPGGIVHITRGALGLIKNESELAGVLGHELIHVTEKHTIESIRKSKVISLTADQAGKAGMTQDVIAQFVEQAYQAILNNKFDRNDENEADALGIQLANRVGYAPAGLAIVLQKIADRNKDQQEPNGMFASHPMIKDRIAKIQKTIQDAKLTASATVAARYTKNITYEAKPLSEVAQVTEGAKGLAGGSSDTAAKKDGDTEKKSKGLFGGKLTLSGGSESKSSKTVASAGARGGVPDRDAAGGPNKNKVSVRVTPAEVAEFKKGIA